MTERCIMPDFDGILQDHYERGYGVQITYKQIPDGGFLLEITGSHEKIVLTKLQDLGAFQSTLQVWKESGELDRLIGHYRRQIVGMTTRSN